jgi:hypothetical protein
MLEAILVDHNPLHVEAKNWLCDTDNWVPPANDSDPERLWNERYAMVALYYSTNGNGWTDNVAWLSPTSVCDWGSSVRCDLGISPVVTGIDLCESCLSLFPPVAQLQQVCHLTSKLAVLTLIALNSPSTPLSLIAILSIFCDSYSDSW